MKIGPAIQDELCNSTAGATDLVPALLTRTLTLRCLFSIRSFHERRRRPHLPNTLIARRVRHAAALNVDRVVSATMSSRRKSPRPAVSKPRAHFYYSEPLPTLKCLGKPLFRSRQARDLACILDIIPIVATWAAPAPTLNVGSSSHTPDFQVTDRDGGVRFLDVADRTLAFDIEQIEQVVRERRATYRLLAIDEIYDGGYRLPNARDLLQYANVKVSLADRLRLLTFLEQEGSLTMSDCFSAIRSAEPVAAIASLILQGFIEVDLDDALIGPETKVRRIHS